MAKQQSATATDARAACCSCLVVEVLLLASVLFVSNDVDPGRSTLVRI